jgi:hypothetical protein
MARTTTEVIQDHLMKRLNGDLEEDIAENFAEDVIILSSFGTFHGHQGVEDSAKVLMRRLGKGTYAYNHTQIEGAYAFLEWTGEAGTQVVCDGADSFIVRDGKIVMQTIHYTPAEK